MSRPRKPIPTPRCHKGAAVLEVYEGDRRRTITLGPWGSPEAQQEYERFLARLRAAKGTTPPDLTWNELADAYIQQAASFRENAERDGGTAPRFALRTVRLLFGETIVAEFGPKMLKSLRDAWVADGLSRKVINGRLGAVRRVVRWGVSEEMVPVEVFQRLLTVEGLRSGRTTAPDRAPVRPAVLADVEKSLPFMPEPVQALVKLQLHSAARAGELVRLCACDIDRTDSDVWTCTPPAHKTAWKGKRRTIYFGSRCREILAPFILKAGGPEEYLFSPRRWEAERNASRSEARKTPRYPSHMKRNAAKRKAKRKRAPRETYTTGTYRRAIERACDLAGVPRFTPHRLRHLAATRARAEFGVDVARALCGHSLASVTEVYSHEVDRALALQAVKKLG